MAELGPDIVADVVARCTENAEAVGTALSAALDATIQAAVGEATQFDAAAPPEGFDGGGLLVLIKAESRFAALVIPSSTGLVPDWCEAPGEKDQSKLATLAEAMCEPLFGELILIDYFETTFTENLTDAMAKGELPEAAPLLPFTLTSEDGKTGVASLIWPLSKAGALVFNEEWTEKDQAAVAGETVTEESPPAAADDSTAAKRVRRGALPPYMQSLMRIEIPISATLASSKQKVEDIISLGPGAILQFEKGCDELLELRAGGRLIARGEAVKVGDKFGLQIKAIELPEERFTKLG